MTLADSSTSARTALFAYGTLQLPQILQALLWRLPGSRPATLLGYRCGLLEGRCYPGIVPASGHRVVGRLLEGLTCEELQRLDDYEGDEYRRARVFVTPHGRCLEPVSCETYLVRERAWSRVTSTPFVLEAVSEAQLRELQR